MSRVNLPPPRPRDGLGVSFVVYSIVRVRKRSIVDTMEPDPVDDKTLALTLERESLKRRVREEISRGAANFHKIIARFCGLQEEYTKEYLAEVIQEVRVEIIAELRNRDATDEVLTFLEENDYLIEEAHAVLASSAEDRDRMSALKQISTLRDQRMKFLQYYGALPRGGWTAKSNEEEQNAASSEVSFLQTKHNAAAEIEVRTVGVDD